MAKQLNGGMLFDTWLKRAMWSLGILGMLIGGITFIHNALEAEARAEVTRVCGIADTNTEEIAKSNDDIKANTLMIHNLEVSQASMHQQLQDMKEMQIRTLDKLDQLIENQ